MQKKEGLEFSYAISIATQLGFLSVASIAGFFMLGMWLDKKLHTAPWFLLAGIVIGIIMAIYEAYHLFRPLITSDKNSHD